MAKLDCGKRVGCLTQILMTPCHPDGVGTVAVSVKLDGVTHTWTTPQIGVNMVNSLVHVVGISTTGGFSLLTPMAPGTYTSPTDDVAITFESLVAPMYSAEAGPQAESKNCTATVTEAGGSGGHLRGTFSGMLITRTSGAVTATEGSFDVVLP